MTKVGIVVLSSQYLLHWDWTAIGRILADIGTTGYG